MYPLEDRKFANDAPESAGTQPEGAAADVDALTREMLAASLPGLSDSELEALATRAQSELHQRIGELLSHGLSDAQLTEFNTLLDTDVDGTWCSKWLRDNVPTYRATVATVRARLVADVVETVSTADPATAAGSRLFGEVVLASTDLVEHYLAGRELNCRREDGELVVQFERTYEQPALLVSIRVPQDGTLLAVTGSMHAVSSPGESRAALDDFAADWNHSALLPKALVSRRTQLDPRQLTGEVTTLLPASLTLAHLNNLIEQSIERILRLSHVARSEGLV